VLLVVSGCSRLHQVHPPPQVLEARGVLKAMGIAVIYSMRSQVRVVVTSSPPGGAVNIRRLPVNL